MTQYLGDWVVPVTIGVALLGPVRADDPPANLPDRALYRLGDHRLHHRSSIHSLAFSPDGRYLAAAGTNHERGVRLWYVETGEQVAYFVEHAPAWGWIEAIAFSPDGTRLAAGDNEGRVSLWDVPQRKLVHEFQTDNGTGITAVAFSPDGAIFAIGDRDGRVTTHLTGNPVKPQWVHGGRAVPGGRGEGIAGGGVVDLQFTPDGNELIAALGDSAVVAVLHPDTGEVVRRVGPLHGISTSTNGGNPLKSVSLTADGRWIVTGGSRYVPTERLPNKAEIGFAQTAVSEVRVWELRDGRQIHDVLGDRLIMGFGYSSLSPDGRTIACAHMSQIDFVDTNSGDVVRSIPLPGWWGSQPVFSPDGTKLAAGVGETIALWDVASGARLFADRPAHSRSVDAVAYSPDGRLIATADFDGRLHVWNAATGAHAWHDSLGDGASIYELRFSGDSELLAACGEKDWHTGRPSPMVNVWKSGGELIATLHPDRRASGVSFSPDRSRIAVAHSRGRIGDERVELWQLDPLRKLAQFPRDETRGLWKYETMTFSPDGRFVFVAEQNGNVSRWDTTPAAEDAAFWADWRTEEQRAENRDPWIGHAVFSPDAAMLVTSTYENLYLWDVAAGKLRETITIPEARHGFRISVAPDNHTLAAAEVLYAGEPGTDVIRIFDLETRELVLKLTPVDARAISLALSPDGKRLITGLDNGTAIVWDVSR